MYKMLFYQVGLSFHLYSENFSWIEVSISCYSVAFFSSLGSYVTQTLDLLCFSCFSHLLTSAAAKSLQSCPTLYDPIDGSPPGSPIPGILQARTLEWVAIALSASLDYFLSIGLSSFFSESSTSGVQFMLRAHSSMGWLPFKCSVAPSPFSSRSQSSSATIQTDCVPFPVQILHWLPPHSECLQRPTGSTCSGFPLPLPSQTWALSELLSAALSPDTSWLDTSFKYHQIRVLLCPGNPDPFILFYFSHGPYCHLTYLMFISLMTCLSH